ncbi:MAG: protein-ADP-ribose hydrolase [Clostridia bacterium]|nr:protein-ADP-ribose hydrolase [Clostridia bacterium]
MTQSEKRVFLINYLLRERGENISVPQGEPSQKRLLRALMNVRLPAPVSDEFLRIQDEYLKTVIAEKGITDADDFDYENGVALWQGDITTLKVDGIVNAANSRLLGCFVPEHHCIDNAIHTFAGVELRNECDRIMREQGVEEPTGQAKITKGYNLPCKYVLHTVGPIVYGNLTEEHEKALSSCYKSCLVLAVAYGLNTLAFCCISTGEFCFPNARAAEIAINSVKEFKAQTGSKIKVIFNVYKDIDYEIYRQLLARD